MKSTFLQNLCNKLRCNKNGRIKPGTLVTFVNPYSYLRLRKAPELLDEMDSFYIDGILLVWLLSLFGVRHCSRVSFDMTSLAPLIFNRAQEEQLSIYIIGTKPGLVDKSCQNIKKHFPRMNIVGYRHGYFRKEEERQEALQTIKDLNPDIVVAGMGAPVQERFLVELRNTGWSGAGFTCGGFLHQTAKDIHYYPGWINRYNLRWLYRVFSEPHTIKRLLIIYPAFVIRFMKEYIEYRRLEL